jgi:hypothetical protein
LIAYPASYPIDSLLQPLGEHAASRVESPTLSPFAGPARTQA